MKRPLFSIFMVSIILFSLVPCGFAYEFSENADAIEVAAASVMKLYIYDEKGKEIATGSGFVAIDNQTLITNYHVIDGGKKITAVSDAGYKYEVSILYCADKDYDVAILGFNAPSDMIPLSLSSGESLKRGEKVVAIGSPIGIRNTVSTGIISALYEESGIPWIQFTAPISHGSSGGPLLNDSGKVIGITSGSFVNGQNLNLAIDISVAKAIYNGWDGNSHHVGDDVSKATLDFTNAIIGQDEFADWNLFTVKDMEISIPKHFTAYTLDELKKDYSVLNSNKNEEEWAAYFEDKVDTSIYLIDEQKNGYDIEIYVEENEGPNYHIYSIDEMKRLIEHDLDDTMTEYCVLDHSQTVFKAIKTKGEDNRYQWNIWTQENGLLYDIYFTTWGNDFSDNQEKEMLLSIKSINMNNAKIRKKKNYLSITTGDIHNVPSTEYNIEQYRMRIAIPNYFSVYYRGLDSSYLWYRANNQNESTVNEFLLGNEYFLIGKYAEAHFFFPEPKDVLSLDYSNFSNLTNSELIDIMDYFSSEYDILERARIIDNLQTPFIRIIVQGDYMYEVVYFTGFGGKFYSMTYESEDMIGEKTVGMLDKIILSIEFY